MSDNQYFAAKEAKKTAGIVLNKADLWFKGLDSNGYLDNLRQMYAAYYGAYFTDEGGPNSIKFAGEQGELVQISVNHLRNFGEHMLNMITSVRPSMQARSINTDYKSQVQTKLANGVLDYYMREKRLETYIKKACEMAIVLGSGYVKLEWNATSGEVYDFSEELGTDIHEGDIEVSNLSPFDVIFDVSREDQKHDWILTRSFKNKFDIAAKYPEYEEDIINLPSKSSLDSFYLDSFFGDDTDLVPVYEFYHKKSESMPEGRYLLFVSESVVLMDSPMPYRNLPIYRIAPSDIMGTPFGFSSLFGLLPMQDMLNALHSTVATNQTAFGVQNVVVPKGGDISTTELAGGLNLIEVDESRGQIRPLNLTSTPKEIFDYMQMLEKNMETISGVNSVARGNPDSNLRSGNALALVQSMTLQFMSGLQQSYVNLIEDLGTGIINILKDYAATPRMVAIVGKSQKTYLKEFTGDDLSTINRVIIDIGNALSRCLAKDTEVLMFNGSVKKVQDIVIGDLVMGPDSKARTVSHVNTGEETMYEITAKDKVLDVKYGANESHILSVKYCSDDGRFGIKKGQILDMSIKEYLGLSPRTQRLMMGYKVGVEYPKKETSIPPYILGAWLGDGTSASTALTTMDPEMVTEWENYASSIGMQMRTSTCTNSGRAKTYFITSGQASGAADRNPFMNALNEMDLINNKHIPENYMLSSRQDRLQILAGLIDTDGTLAAGSCFVFTQKDDNLANQVVTLSRSLGFRTTYNKRKSVSSTLPGKKGIEFISETNAVVISGNTWEVPTKIARKQAPVRTYKKDPLNYSIKLENKGMGTFYGFTLKEEPHFLLADFTVTHNTTAGRVEMAEQLLQMGLIKSPQQYFSVMDTGNLDVMTEDEQSQLFLTKGENEFLMDAKPVFALFNDDHDLHIREHSSVLSDPEMRLNPELVTRVLTHIQEHMDLLRGSKQTAQGPQANADYLQIMGQQPLGPVGGSPAGQPNQQPPNNSMQGQQGIPQMMDPAQQLDPMSMVPTNLPQPAQPPPVDGLQQPGNPQEAMMMQQQGKPVGS